MSIALVQVAPSVRAAAATSASLTISGVTAGNLLWSGVAFGGSPSLSSFTDTNGTPVLAAGDSGSNPLEAQYYEENAAAGTHALTVTASFSANLELFAAEYGGVTTSGALDGTMPAETSGTTTSIVGPSATPSAPSDLAIAFIAQGAGGITFSGYTSGFTQESINTAGPTAAFADLIGTGTGALSCAVTSTSTAAWKSSIALFKAASGATGTAAITEGSDTTAATGNIAIPGTASITEASDMVAATGAIAIAGTAAITEGSDTVAATGVGGEVGTAAITESSDTVSATGTLSVTGSAAITEQPDIAAASGGITLSGAAAIFEGGDIVVASGGLGLAGSASITEASDSVAGTGSGPQPSNPMPNFIGFPINYVIQILAAQGLAASLTYQLADPPGTTMGLITAQSPAPGQQLKAPVSFTCTGAIALPAVGVRSGNVPALLVGNNDNPGGRSTNS